MTLDQIKKAFKELSPEKRAAFVEWCVSYQESEELKELSRCSNGIEHSAAMAAFRKVFDACRTAESASCIDGSCAMIKFYRDTRVRQCPFSADADMLLFQWGPDPKQRQFTLTFTRQLIPQTSRDPSVWQLHLEYTYPLDTATKKLGAGSQWCRSIAPPEYTKFQEFMREWKVTDELHLRAPAKVDVRYEKV